MHISKAIGCADPSRQAARWYKYMNGITAPSSSIVQAVDEWLPGSGSIFNHPLWELTGRTSITSAELRSLVVRLGSFAGLIADVDVLTTSSSPFWRKPNLDYRAVISSVTQAYGPARTALRLYQGLTATLVTLIHDAEHAQRQVQHFEVHLGMVQHLLWVRQQGLLCEAWVGKVEALLVERWLSTEYRLPRLREFMKHLASIDHSSVHRKVAARDLSAAAQQRLKSLQGQWVIEEIARRPPRLELPLDR